MATCNHRRPKLNLPGYTPPRFAWQPPAQLPQDLPSLTRAVTEAFRGIYATLQDVGRSGTVVPLLEDMDARAGQTIVGVADGQTITLPQGQPGELNTVTVVLTGVEEPVTVVNPDQSTQEVGVAGVYDFIASEPEQWQLDPGTNFAQAIPPQRVLGNDLEENAQAHPITVHQELDWVGGSDGIWVFDGIDDRVTFGDFNDFERNQPFTVSAWVQATSVASQQVIIGKLQGSTTFRGWEMGLETPGRAYLLLSSNFGGGDIINTQTVNDQVPIGALTHVACVYDGGGLGAGITIYVNGVSVATTIAGVGPLVGTTLSTQQLSIGRRDVTSNLPLGGLLSHVSVFDEALTASDIAEIYNAGTPPDLNDLPSASPPVFWVKFDADDTTGASGVADHGTGNHDGTAAGGLGPVPPTGSILMRGPELWQLLTPGTDGYPLLAQGPNAIPAYQLLPLSSIEAVLAESFIGNFTASSASPTARAGSSVAGAGLTYTAGGTLAVGSSTSIAVNANDIQRAALTGVVTAAVNSNTTAFASVAANTILANATAGTAAPTFVSVSADSLLARVGGNLVSHPWSTLAGGGLTYSAGVMAVGAGTGITVNANDVAVTIPLTDGDKGDITVASSGTSWTIDSDAVTNTKLANMAVGTVKGRPIDAGSTGDPQDLTGAQVGSLARRYWWETTDTTSSGTVNGYVLTDKQIQVHFNLASPVTINSFTVNDGKMLELVLESSSAAVTLTNENASGTLGKIRTPGAVDLVLTGGDACIMTYINNRYRVTGVSRRGVTDRDYGDVTVTSNGLTWTIDNSAVTNAKMANMSAGTVKLRALGAGTGAPVDGTGFQLGVICRWESFVVDSTSSGTTALYTITESLLQVNFKISGTFIIQGMTFSSAMIGKRVTFQCDRGFSGVVEWEDESGSTASVLERIRLPGAERFRIREGEQCTFVYWDSRWRLETHAKRIEPFMLTPVASDMAVPFYVRKAFSATGASGTVIDAVTVWNADAPFALRILSATLRVATALAAATADLRTASGGGGSVVLPDAATSTFTFDVGTTGPHADTAAATATVAASGSLYLRVDRSVAGELILECVRT